MATKFFAPEDERTNWTSEYLKATFAKRVDFVDEQLGDSPFIIGDRFTAADISVGYTIGMAEDCGRHRTVLETSRLPRAPKGAARLSARCEPHGLSGSGREVMANCYCAGKRLKLCANHTTAQPTAIAMYGHIRRDVQRRAARRQRLTDERAGEAPFVLHVVPIDEIGTMNAVNQSVAQRVPAPKVRADAHEREIEEAEQRSRRPTAVGQRKGRSWPARSMRWIQPDWRLRKLKMM